MSRADGGGLLMCENGNQLIYIVKRAEVDAGFQENVMEFIYKGLK